MSSLPFFMDREDDLKYFEARSPNTCNLPKTTYTSSQVLTRRPAAKIVTRKQIDMTCISTDRAPSKPNKRGESRKHRLEFLMTFIHRFHASISCIEFNIF